MSNSTHFVAAGLLVTQLTLLPMEDGGAATVTGSMPRIAAGTHHVSEAEQRVMEASQFVASHLGNVEIGAAHCSRLPSSKYSRSNTLTVTAGRASYSDMDFVVTALGDKTFEVRLHASEGRSTFTSVPINFKYDEQGRGFYWKSDAEKQAFSTAKMVLGLPVDRPQLSGVSSPPVLTA
ncbi:MAG: hypothetical protein EB059_06540 [Alphaproteobacteria bacterium]|nr:hypothetical protein [Alphaproteobacteria bacterium]